MKTTIAYLFSIIVLTSCGDDILLNKDNDLAKAGLKGKVKSQKTAIYEAVPFEGKVIKGPRQSFSNNDIYIYNTEGNMNEILIHDENLLPKAKIERTYDEKGRCTEYKKQDTQINIISITSLSYNSDGYKTSETHSKYGHTASRTNYIYNEKGDVIEERTTIYDNYTYKGKTYSVDSSKIITYKYEYDENHNIIKSYSIDNAGTVKYKKEYFYDKKNLKTQENNYDLQGRVINTSKYKHNKYGDIISLISYNSRGETVESYSYKYEYDKYKNWIKETSFNADDEPEYITEQIIEYYEND